MWITTPLMSAIEEGDVQVIDLKEDNNGKQDVTVTSGCSREKQGLEIALLSWILEAKQTAWSPLKCLAHAGSHQFCSLSPGYGTHQWHLLQGWLLSVCRQARAPGTRILSSTMCGTDNCPTREFPKAEVDNTDTSYVLRHAEPVRTAVERARAKHFNADGNIKGGYKEKVHVYVNLHII